jgi:hypothetical protein
MVLDLHTFMRKYIVSDFVVLLTVAKFHLFNKVMSEEVKIVDRINEIYLYLS